MSWHVSLILAYATPTIYSQSLGDAFPVALRKAGETFDVLSLPSETATAMRYVYLSRQHKSVRDGALRDLASTLSPRNPTIRPNEFSFHHDL